MDNNKKPSGPVEEERWAKIEKEVQELKRSRSILSIGLFLLSGLYGILILCIILRIIRIEDTLTSIIQFNALVGEHAKNRFDLPEEVPFDYASIAACIPGAMSAQAPKPEPQPRSQPEADILPSPQQEAKPVAQPQPAPLQESSEKNVLLSLGVPEKLAALMSANKVSCEELQGVVGKRGYFPEDMPIKDYPADFVEGCLIAAWPQVFQMVLDNRDIPF